MVNLTQGVFTGANQKKKNGFSQPELLLHEILYLREVLVDSLNYFLFWWWHYGDDHILTYYQHFLAGRLMIFHAHLFPVLTIFHNFHTQPPAEWL